MQLSNREIAIVLAIVKVFETGKPLGDPSAVAVLKDGAGISYGLSQFTHASGNLFHVLERYRKLGGAIPNEIGNHWTSIKTKTFIASFAINEAVKRELRTLGKDPLMYQAQIEIAREKFLNPAIKAAAGSHFTTPLALAVIYDSKVHGSFDRIRDRVAISRAEYSNDAAFEQAWIADYVKQRRHWLANHTRKILNNTVYRMDFFLGEIRRGNWHLQLPLLVYGKRLTPAMFATSSASAPPVPDQSKPPAIPPDGPSGTPEVQQAGPHGDQAEQVPGKNSGQGSVVSGQTDGSQNSEAEVSVDAPPPTGFMAKLKGHFAALFAMIGGGAGLKEYLGIQLGEQTVTLLKYIVPTVLVLGFIGLIVWYITEKIVGWKTLEMQAKIATDVDKPNLRITPQ